MCSWLVMTEYSVSMWHILSTVRCYILHMVTRKKIIGQVEVKNEFNQAHLRLIDIYCRLNQINVDIHFAHEITVIGYHFSMS